MAPASGNGRYRVSDAASCELSVASQYWFYYSLRHSLVRLEYPGIGFADAAFFCLQPLFEILRIFELSIDRRSLTTVQLGLTLAADFH